MRCRPAATRMTALALAAVLLGPAAGAAAVLVDSVLAAVEGTPITAGDVALARAVGLFGLTEAAAPIGAPDIERLIRARLVVAEAERLDVEVAAAELEAAWRTRAAPHGGEGTLVVRLARQGVEAAWARRMLRDHLRYQRFLELRFRAFVFVLEEEVQAALGPGEHAADARDRARERLRSEEAERRLADWLAEALSRARIERLPLPEAGVPLPWTLGGRE